MRQRSISETGTDTDAGSVPGGWNLSDPGHCLQLCPSQRLRSLWHNILLTGSNIPTETELGRAGTLRSQSQPGPQPLARAGADRGERHSGSAGATHHTLTHNPGWTDGHTPVSIMTRHPIIRDILQRLQEWLAKISEGGQGDPGLSIDSAQPRLAPGSAPGPGTGRLSWPGAGDTNAIMCWRM